MTEVAHVVRHGLLLEDTTIDVFRVIHPLTRIIGGLPIAIYDPKCNWSYYFARPNDRSEWMLGRAVLDANGRAENQVVLAVARWSLIPLLLLGGYFGFRLTCADVRRLGRRRFSRTMVLLTASIGLGRHHLPGRDRGGAWPRGHLHVSAVAATARLEQRDNCRRMPRLAAAYETDLIVAFALWPLIWCMWVAPRCLGSGPVLAVPALRQLAAVLLLGLVVLNLGYLFDGDVAPWTSTTS